MRRRLSRRVLIGCGALLSGGVGVVDGALLTPSDLTPGQTYQLAFVTSGVTAATSAEIATYNGFVQTAANAAGMGSVTWRVIGSSMTVNASSNAPVSTRVYNMNGELVATGFADFWDGSHANPIDYTENNAGRNFNVWTGTRDNGTSGGAGDALGEATPFWGESTFSNAGWAAHGGNTNTVTYSLYALSEVLTVVPEPATLLLLSAGAMALAWRPRRRAR